jgi:hypothetical protein
LFTIFLGKVVVVGPKASNAQIKNRTYTSNPVDGALAFGIVMIEANAQLRFAKQMELNTDLIQMRAQSIASADTVVLSCAEAHLEGGSTITTSGRGPVFQSGNEPGKEMSGAGSGAGHGGRGGPSTTTTGGSGYGSYINPVHPGSGGGGTSGGRGGSTIKV